MLAVFPWQADGPVAAGGVVWTSLANKLEKADYKVVIRLSFRLALCYTDT